MSKLIRDDINYFYQHDISIPDKTMYIGGEVDENMTSKVIKGLHVLDTKNRKKRILVLFNNIGGDEYHGLAIYDAIRECKSPTVIKVYGHAMSMGSWILQAGTKRYLTPNSTLMIHYGTTGYEGHSKDFMQWGEEAKRLCELMENAYLERIKEKHPRYTREQLQELIRFDKFLSASDAVSLGLADKIV